MLSFLFLIHPKQQGNNNNNNMPTVWSWSLYMITQDLYVELNSNLYDFFLYLT